MLCARPDVLIKRVCRLQSFDLCLQTEGKMVVIGKGAVDDMTRKPCHIASTWTTPLHLSLIPPSSYTATYRKNPLGIEIQKWHSGGSRYQRDEFKDDSIIVLWLSTMLQVSLNLNIYFVARLIFVVKLIFLRRSSPG